MPERSQYWKPWRLAVWWLTRTNAGIVLSIAFVILLAVLVDSLR